LCRIQALKSALIYTGNAGSPHPFNFQTDSTDLSINAELQPDRFQLHHPNRTIANAVGRSSNSPFEFERAIHDGMEGLERKVKAKDMRMGSMSRNFAVIGIDEAMAKGER